MKTIWKQPIELTARQVVKFPSGAAILTAGIDPQGVPCVWAAVDPTQPIVDVPVLMIGTGELMPDDSMFVGMIVAGDSVAHILQEGIR
jgi:hypothetical protein